MARDLGIHADLLYSSNRREEKGEVLQFISVDSVRAGSLKAIMIRKYFRLVGCLVSMGMLLATAPLRARRIRIRGTSPLHYPPADGDTVDLVNMLRSQRGMNRSKEY